MNWIKTNYERAILIFFAIALLACSGLVGWMAFSFPESFSGRKNLKAPDNKISALDFTSVAEAAALADAPRTWSLHEGSLFVSRIYVLKGGKPPLINPTESDVPIHPPISNAWIQKYGLDFSDSKLKDQDPDGDGFTNLEEFLGGADPTDPKSHPPFYTKLRLKNFISKPFFLKFSGDSGDNTYTINTKSGKSRTQFVKIGDMIKGTPYKVISYEKKSGMRNEMEIDISELLIENTDTSEKIALVINKETNDPTSFGEFTFLLDGSTIPVKKDDEFALPPEPTRKFKLIDISAQEAKIQDLSTKEKILVKPAE